MADPREWISQVKAESPPDLWSEVMKRASTAAVPRAERPWAGRPGMPRRAAFVTGVAAGTLALTLVVVGLRGAPPFDDRPTPTPGPAALDRVHQRLEDTFSQLWIAETQLLLHQGELEVAQENLTAIMKAAGATPTDAEQHQIFTAQNIIEAITVGIRAARGELELLRPRIEQLREARAELLPPSDAAAYPDVVTVRCGGGDGDGGTHVSTPVVRARADGTHMRIVNAFQTERARLLVDDALVDELPPATTADVVLPARPSGDVEILCTYDEPPFGLTRPSHPLWIVSSEGGVASETPPPVSQLDPFTLTVSLDEEPVIWPEVAVLPIGDAEQEIGHSDCSDCVLPVPSALAVDRDGSFWIADGLKARIAHFDSDGSFIEALPAEIGSAVPDSSGSADLAFVEDRLYVLLEEGRSRIAPVEAGALGEPIIVNNDGHGLDVQAVIPGQEELTVMISGAERLLGGYWAFATVDPSTGQVTPSAGVKNSTGAYVDLQPRLDGPAGTFEIRWSRDGYAITTVQELRFQLVRGGKDVRTTVGDTYMRTATHWGVATVMSIGDGQGTPVGKWYLEILPESPSIVFERLPDEGFIGDARRYLTVGTDGEVYWMRLLDDGLHIYRR